MSIRKDRQRGFSVREHYPDEYWRTVCIYCGKEYDARKNSYCPHCKPIRKDLDDLPDCRDDVI